MRAGFSVSAKTYNAVKKNRAKRLMRAAYEQERKDLADAAGKAGGALSVLFIYKGGKDVSSGPVVFERVRGDMSSICRKLCVAGERERT